MALKLSDYHGEVSRCHCTNHDPAQPTDCNICFCRGYVAKCLKCDGKGQIEEGVAGAAAGTMKVTCPICGGKAKFPVNRPDNWDALHPVKQEVEEESATDSSTDQQVTEPAVA